MSPLFLLSLLASSILPSVIAHGQVTRITIDGEKHDAWTVNAPPKDSAIRHVNNYEPMLGVNNPGINCGPGATQAAALVADANPGADVRVRWNGADGVANWPHNTGPMLTYMASCEGDCTKFDSTKAQWFKIHEAGRKDGNGDWMQQDLMNGQEAVVPLPKDIKPGQYLFRHEIIALHVAPGAGSAEFYVGCAQINVGGQGKGVPQPNELVKLPGAYKDSDTGISAEDVFTTNVYKMPGPKVAAFVDGGDAGDNDQDGGDDNKEQDEPSKEGDDKEQDEPSKEGDDKEQGSNGDKGPYVGQCYLSGKRSVNRPRAISRVMRDIDLMAIH